jgi:hypothetical protein
MRKLFSAAMALIAALSFTTARPAQAISFTAHCFGKAILYVGDSAGKSISNPIIDFGQLATYTIKNGHASDCQGKAWNAARSDSNFMNKTWLCQQLQRHGDFRLSVYAAVGDDPYYDAGSTYATCTGGVTTCVCPAGWSANPSNVVGGYTSDGKCKRAVGGGIAINPLPPDGTPIGTWGFTWGNAVVAWGSAANGGAAACNTTPWQGH